MSQPHPTLTLILDIDSRLDSRETRLEIQRTYAYVGNTLVRAHTVEDEEEPIENTMNLLLKLGRRQYLYSADEGADALWNGFLEKWFSNAFHKIGNHMKIFNRRQRTIGLPELVFDWVDLQLQNGKLHVRMHTDTNSDILPSTSAWLTAVRTALNAGKLGEQVECITMPSPEHYFQQYEAGLAAKEERLRQMEEEEAARQEAERIAAEQAEALAEESFLESPELVEADAAEDDGKSDETPGENLADDAGYDAENGESGEGSETADAEGEEGEGDEEPEEPRHSDFTHEVYQEDANYDFDEPDFLVDYHIWTIDYADGTQRVYDSQADAYLEME